MKLRSNKLDAMTFNSIADLKSFPSSRFSDGAVANVLGYYAPGDGGGGDLYFNEAGSGANEVTSYAASGGGIWERRNYEFIDIRYAGALGDYNTSTKTGTDNRNAISAALDASVDELKGMFIPSGKFWISDTIVNASLSPVYIFGEAGSEIHGDVTVSGFGYFDLYSVFPTSDRPSLTLASSISSGDYTFTVSDASGVETGALVYFSTTIIAENGRNRTKQELVEVAGVNGAVIETLSSFKFPYTAADAGLSIRYTNNPRSITIDGVKFVVQLKSDEPNTSPIYNVLAVRCFDASNITFSNCIFESPSRQAFTNLPPAGGPYTPPYQRDGTYINRCSNTVVSNCVFDGVFYGHTTTASNSTKGTNCYGRFTRHPFTHNFFSKGVFIDRLSGEQNNGLIDSHEAFDVHYSNCYTLTDNLASNLRSIGGSITNSKIVSVTTNSEVYLFDFGDVRFVSPFGSLYDNAYFYISNTVFDWANQDTPLQGLQLRAGNYRLSNVDLGPNGIEITAQANTTTGSVIIDKTTYDKERSVIVSPFNVDRPAQPGIPIFMSGKSPLYKTGVFAMSHTTDIGTGDFTLFRDCYIPKVAEITTGNPIVAFIAPDYKTANPNYSLNVQFRASTGELWVEFYSNVGVLLRREIIVDFLQDYGGERRLFTLKRVGSVLTIALDGGVILSSTNAAWANPVTSTTFGLDSIGAFSANSQYYFPVYKSGLYNKDLSTGEILALLYDDEDISDANLLTYAGVSFIKKQGEFMASLGNLQELAGFVADADAFSGAYEGVVRTKTALTADGPITGQSQLVLPIGSYITEIIYRNNGSGTANVSLGTTAGGTDIVNAQGIGATTQGAFTIASRVTSFQLPREIFVSSSSWTNVSLLLNVYFRVTRGV